MKVSREQAALNRARVVDTAARLFRERGADGIGVADLMKGAGLTHGGFYGQFASKEELLAEACRQAFAATLDGWGKLVARDGPRLPSIGDWYLSAAHRDHPGAGCVVAALGADAARAGPAVRAALTEGAQGQIAALETLLPAGEAGENRRLAIAAYAAMIGAVVLARAVDDSGLSDEIMAAVAAGLPGRAEPATSARTAPAAGRRDRQKK